MSGTFGIHLDRTDGEHNPQAKLNANIVRHLRASFSRKPPEMGIMEFCSGWAAMFGVSPGTVQKAVKGRKWRF